MVGGFDSESKKQLDRRIAELEAIYEVDRATANSLGVGEVLERGLDLALSALRLDMGAIYRADAGAVSSAEPVSLDMHSHRGLPPEMAATLRRLGPGEGLTGLAVRERRALVCSLAEYPWPALLPILARAGVESVASAPFLSSDRVFGAITVCIRDRKAFNSHGLALLQSIGFQLGGALERASLTESMANRLRQMEAVYAIDLATARTLDGEEVMRRGAEAAMKALDVHLCTVLLLEPDGFTLRPRVFVGPDELAEYSLRPRKVGDGISGMAVQRRSPVVVQVDEYEPARSWPTVVAASLKTLAATPLLSGGEVFGAMVIASSSRRDFAVAEHDLLRSVGIQLGAAVHRARLFEAATMRQDELEEEVERRTHDLRDANAALQRMLSICAHEIRNPLTAISGFASLLLMSRRDPLTVQQKEYLQTITRNADQITNLTDDLLLASRFQSGLFTIKPEKLDAASIARQTAESLSATFQARRQELVVQAPHVLEFEADPARLKQVLSNLLTNASKYSPEKKPVTLEVSQAPGEMVLFEVADQGIGISEEDLPRIFSPFFRANNTETRGQVGHGLGLSVTKMLVELHGGEIAVTSKRGVGTTVSVCLPLRPPPVSHAPQMSSASS